MVEETGRASFSILKAKLTHQVTLSSTRDGGSVFLSTR
ncbi:hypothetical protein SLEP1_g35834 [Rubroshorea leprosula]|uniref:Uncharacterized protein n=1 Tax=Rubroshorea leprosula TaxID=152421 RepID=A0AAV5KPH5_9ROSI|nr:hypothetical protein SLEP1_g35834 [Rubroshorea leprosula]